MFEPKDLLAPTATLFVVIFAISSFLILRALALYRERMMALSDIDVPEDIRKRFGFRIGIVGDFLLLFMVGISLLVLGVVFCPDLLYKIANFYLGSTALSKGEILIKFRDLASWLKIISVAVLVTPFVLLGNDMFVSKKLPIIVRVFAGSVLGQRIVSDDESKTLLPEARKFYEEGILGQAVLYAVAALEVRLKNKMGIPANYGLRKVVSEVTDKLEKVVSREELEVITKVRNIAAHPSRERRVGREDTKQVLSIVERILNALA